jgi:DNA modification methylase
VILRADARHIPLRDESVDSIVTDPPYELGFMGKKWDSSGVAYSVDVWAEALRVLKPGGHLLAFGGSRTYHRLACAIEDAGFEIRDQIQWVYGSGFPKSLDVSKAIDKAAGAEREVVGRKGGRYEYGFTPESAAPLGSNAPRPNAAVNMGLAANITAPATDAARQWSGWGTALKPAVEPLVFARKPFTDGDLIDTIGSKINTLEARLWSLLSASVAEKNFGLSRNEYDAACAFARWSAEEKSNIQAASLGRMDMSQFESVLFSCLSIASSWRSTWAALFPMASKSTIETGTDKITDLKTLNSSLSTVTPQSIIEAATAPGGLIVNASPAVRYFSGEMLRLSGILSLSAQGSATGNPPIFSPDADAKPYSRPIVVARKPLIGTVAANVQAHGTGAINVDGCRVEGTPRTTHASGNIRTKTDGPTMREGFGIGERPAPAARWPANVIHDGSEEVVRLFPNVNGATSRTDTVSKGMFHGGDAGTVYPDSGSAARFFYCAKASKEDRDWGLSGGGRRIGEKGNGLARTCDVCGASTIDGCSCEGRTYSNPLRKNHHPTVKPVDLMRYLCRLVTPPGGVVLDPFAGSGSTLRGAFLEGFKPIGIELDAEYCRIARGRMNLLTPVMAGLLV